MNFVLIFVFWYNIDFLICGSLKFICMAVGFYLVFCLKDKNLILRVGRPLKKRLLFFCPYHIPENVEFNILAWLPVKSVIRFRCVCKPWDSFIISNSNSKYHGCFINVPDSFGKKGKVCEVFCDRTYDIISEYPVPSGFDRFYVGSTSAGIVGLCNGLLCIPHYKGYCIDVIYLYNPSIRKFKRLPDSSFSERYDGLLPDLVISPRLMTTRL